MKKDKYIKPVTEVILLEEKSTIVTSPYTGNNEVPLVPNPDDEE